MSELDDFLTPDPSILSRDGCSAARGASLLDPCAVFLTGQVGQDNGPFGTSKDWRRAKILAAARSMVEERGFDHVKVRPLARRAGVTPPTIYNLIGGREYVLQHAIQEGVDAKRRLAIQSSTTHGTLPILSYIDIASLAMVLYPRYYKQIMKDLSDTPFGRMRKKDLTSHVCCMFKSWLDEMSEQGHFRTTSLDNKTVATQLSEQFSDCMIEWSRNEVNSSELRREAVVGAALVLLAIVVPDQASRIESWLDGLSWLEGEAVGAQPPHLVEPRQATGPWMSLSR